MGRKDFKKHNLGFVCINCAKANPPASKSERNHCRSCLFSLHVDDKTPGDRASMCNALMEPSALDYRGNKGFMILHRCVKCGKEILNRAAPDDDIVKQKL